MISQKVLCRFGWHDWTKWMTQGDVKVWIHRHDLPDCPKDEETYEIQERECTCCGKKKYRRERK